MYNPLKHKKPYGGTAVGIKTTITFPLDTNFCIKRVFVIFRNDKGQNERFELFKTNKDTLKNLGFNLNYYESNEEVFLAEIEFKQSGIWFYRFEGIYENGDVAYFGKGFDGTAIRRDWQPEWQLTISEKPYKTPNWAKSGLIYHIFPDRFCKGEEREFSKKGYFHTDWYERPFVAVDGFDYQADDFYGGNIKGVIEKLDYLKELGVSTIYFSPIFEACSNHRYDTGNYLKIDSLFGDEKQFEKLLNLAKQKDINIILDGVFNHTGADSLYFNRFNRYQSVGAYQSKDSKYFDWFYFYDFPNNYHCWWGCTAVPTVNKSSDGYRKLILGENGVIEKWTKLGVKGWRFDVVDELPIKFTTDLCQKIKQVDDDALLIGEVWEDATTKISYGELRPYFMGNQLDGVMNYPFKKAIMQYVMTGDKDYFINLVQSILENYPKESLDVLMNMLGTHDTVRALTALSGVEAPFSKADRQGYKMDEYHYNLAVARLKFASTLQYMLPGVPCLYYGDEAGVEGFEDPLNRATYPWGRENHSLLAHYKEIGKLREKYKSILQGETIFVSHENLLIFKRVSKSGELTIFSNRNDFDVYVEHFGKDAYTDEKVENFIIKPNDIRIIFSC